MRLTLLKDVLIASGTGVGGGSLVYANTLYEPLDPFYRDPQWAHITDWKDELAPHYAQAKKMLGVTTYPGWTPADELMAAVAADMGASDSFHPTEVGVLFGDSPGEAIAGPVLRWSRTRAQRLHRLWRLHDRLPSQRQEHLGQELPVPRRIGRRGRPRDDDRHRRAPRRIRLRGPHATHRQPTAPTPVHGRAGGLRRQRAEHPGPAAPTAAAIAAAPVAAHRRAEPHQLRGRAQRSVR